MEIITKIEIKSADELANFIEDQIWCHIAEQIPNIGVKSLNAALDIMRRLIQLTTIKMWAWRQDWDTMDNNTLAMYFKRISLADMNTDEQTLRQLDIIKLSQINPVLTAL